MKTQTHLTRLTRPLALMMMLIFGLLLGLSNVSGEQSVTVAWNFNTEPFVSGYKVYYGVASRQYTNVIDVHNVCQRTVLGLKDGVTYWMAVTAYATNGVESDYSEEVTFKNTSPVVSPISDLVVLRGNPLSPVSLTIRDAETPASNLIVRAYSTNQALIPRTNLLITGVSSNRTLAFVSNASLTANLGTTRILLAVSDNFKTVTQAFNLTITDTIASPGITIDQTVGLISAVVTNVPVDAKSIYWAKEGLIVDGGEVLTLSGRMYYAGDGAVSAYLVDRATGYWISPERVISIDSSYGFYQTELVVFNSSTNATLYVACGLLPGIYQFQQIQVTATTPTVRPVADLYLKQLLPKQVAGLCSVQWAWNPAPSSQGYVVKTALLRDDIEKGTAGLLYSQQALLSSQRTYRLDVPTTFYGGVYVSVSSVVGGKESAPWITWYMPGDIFNTADENIPPLCFTGGVDTNDVNYAYTGYTTSRRTPALVVGQSAGREERTDVDNNAYAGRVSDYNFIRSQYLNGRRMK